MVNITVLFIKYFQTFLTKINVNQFYKDSCRSISLRKYVLPQFCLPYTILLLIFAHLTNEHHDLVRVPYPSNHNLQPNACKMAWLPFLYQVEW